MLELVSTHERQALVETAGAKQTLNLVLPNAVVNLAVDSNPKGAQLWMDGRQVALTPATLTLRAGQPVKLEVKQLGYVDWVMQVTPDRGKNLDYDLILEKTAELLAQEAAEAEAKAALEAEEAKAVPGSQSMRDW